MQEQQHEKLSLLLDDELDSAQAATLLKTMRTDADLQAKFQRYTLISQALKNEQCSIASLDFVDKVHQRLEKEPTYFLPKKSHTNHLRKAGLAVAASLLLVVSWLSANRLHKLYDKSNTIAQQSVEAEQINARFREYLQAHDNVWYVSNNIGIQPYAHVASFQKK